MEAEWAKAALDNKVVRVEVSPVYSGSTPVPGAIDVTYWIDGARRTRTFNNATGP